MDEPNIDTTETADTPPPPFWSPAATVGWGLLIVLVFVTVQFMVAIVWGIAMTATESDLHSAERWAEVATSGEVLSISTLASALVCGSLVLLLAFVGRHSPPRESLALAPPSISDLARWLALTLLLIVISDGLTTVLGKPIVPEFMADIVANTSLPPLLWVAIIVAAPLFEELFFRGFLITGLRQGSLGDAGAIVLTSVAWASIHIQYGLYEITTIFIFGLILGVARIGSRSLWVPVAMHMTANLVATLEAYIVPGVPG